ncbi:unnamed protein product [Aureobasidium vineae]|uniref:Uncharacterized protein n=1 Tax=Aureobasidium vineae TaxID=2773715 RepID=A0A9N8JCU8_9PEZI|nr:unnamed protein product [Aureobasidium vineae]
MTRGKRKAEATQSADSRSSKRRADVEEISDQSASEEEEDQGRIESQQMLLVIDRLKHKDDGWIDKMRADIDKDQEALIQMLDDKERELADLDSQFHNKIRSLLTDVLGGPAPKQRKGTDTQDIFYLRPAHEHAHLLFTKAEDLIKQYNHVSDAIDTGRDKLATDHLETFEKDKNDVAEMLHAGQELARRQIQQVLKRPDDRDSPRNKTKSLFTEERLDDVASMFKVLRDETREEDEGVKAQQETRTDITDGDGLFPIIHNTKKGVKKLAGHLIADEE